MSRGKLVLAVALVVLVVFSLGLLFTNRGEKTPKYRTEAVDRGTVVATVTATGTLSAVTTVNVGSQVSGIISRLYADFNSKVTKGQLLAELDPTTIQTQVDQRRADLEKAQVDERNSKVSFQRSKNLLDNQLIARSDYDTAEANFLSAHAAVKQAEAALRQAQTNLTYTKIYSPIDGVVVDRQVDIGQTVAASFQAPTLFTLAQNLTEMRVSTAIDEADIGKIRTGIEANFTVDAFPDRTYRGIISQVRLSPSTVQNVVTYPVLIDVPNPNLELKPGMTANVTIPYEKKENILKIPNAALRFRPDPEDTVGATASKGNSRNSESGNRSGAGNTGGSQGRRQGSGSGRESGRSGGSWSQGGGNAESASVYVITEKGQLRPVSVRTSITDGNYTVIEGGDLKEGDQIVTGLQTARAMQTTGGLGSSSSRGRRGPGF